MRKKIYAVSLALVLAVTALHADPISVKHTQGATRGFLLVRSQSGELLANGELTQLAEGDRVTWHLIFHFHDGSIDDDTAVFSQRKVFRLISEHHIQKGPFFTQPIDIAVNVATGNVISRSVDKTDKNGAEKAESQHLKIPADISNGMMGTLLLNVPPDTPPFKLAMLAPSGKGRLVKLDISTESPASFQIGGMTMSATVFRVHMDIGGLAGVIAPIIGKQPEDTMVWIVQGKAPAFIRQVGQLSLGGPVVSIQLAGTSF
jgi:hypothetical protein